MSMRLVTVFASFAVLGSCSGTIAGILVDADSGEPVPNAIIQVASTSWGTRDGRLVWDK